MSGVQQVWRIAHKFGIAFGAPSEPAQDVYKKLKQNGIPCSHDVHMTDGAYYIEVDPRMIPDGLPISADFVGQIRALGGRFTSSPMASFFNRNVIVPAPKMTP